jgi:putative addiction module component (TIGR02574 family)
MTATAQKIEQEIRRLPVEDKVALHEHLVADILDAAEAHGLEPSYRDEVKRRVAEIKAGRAKGVDAFKALKKM